jgi:hypothetical protein
MVRIGLSYHEIRIMGKIWHFLKSDRLTLALRLLLAALILTAAIPKFSDIEKYSVYLVYNYRVFPMYPVNIARFLGTIAPYLEFLIALGLLFGVLTRLSAVGWGIMSLLYFCIKLDMIFIQGRIEPCGCFPGIFPGILVTQSIWIDLISMIFCAQIIWANRERRVLSFWLLLPQKWHQTGIRIIW